MCYRFSGIVPPKYNINVMELRIYEVMKGTRRYEVMKGTRSYGTLIVAIDYNEPGAAYGDNVATNALFEG